MVSGWAWSSGAADEAAGLVFEEEAVDDLLEGSDLGGVEAVDGLEAHPEGLLLRSALGLVEEESVAGDAEAAGELAEDLQGGLGLAGLIAADLGDVDAGLVGEGLLGEALEAAEGDEAVGEGHLRQKGC